MSVVERTKNSGCESKGGPAKCVCGPEGGGVSGGTGRGGWRTLDRREKKETRRGREQESKRGGVGKGKKKKRP